MGLTAAQERTVERFEADRVAVSAALHLMQDEEQDLQDGADRPAGMSGRYDGAY